MTNNVSYKLKHYNRKVRIECEGMAITMLYRDLLNVLKEQDAHLLYNDSMIVSKEAVLDVDIHTIQ